MIDMGGASAQIAFEIPAINEEEKTNLSGNVQIVNLGSREEDRRFRYRLFVATFLGFGVNEGAKRYEKLLWKRMSDNLSSNSSREIPFVSDNCLPSNMLKLAYNYEENSQFVRKV